MNCDPVKLVYFGVGVVLESKEQGTFVRWAVTMGARRKFTVAEIYLLVVAGGGDAFGRKGPMYGSSRTYVV